MNVVVNCGLKRVKLVKVEKKGLLFLSYGSPSSKEDLVPYMTSIRHGRVPTEGEIANLTRRYDVIDQWSNLELQKMAENQYKNVDDFIANYAISYWLFTHETIYC